MSSALRSPADSIKLIEQVEVGAALVEHAFLLAGQGLGDGLNTFEDTSRALKAFVAEFRGGAIEDAAAALDRLARQLFELGEALPRDAALLRDLAADNEGISKHLEALLEHIRMMGIIATSARIEAAILTDGAGLDGFTSDMRVLTQAVRTTISRCASQHAAMTERICRLMDAQTALDRDFHDRILCLAREVAESFNFIATRQARGCALAQDLVGRSSRLTGEVGNALVALQSGDATRQRLEHVAVALRLASDIRAGENAGIMLPIKYRAIAASALDRLQAIQINDLVSSFEIEAKDVDHVFRRLGDDACSLNTAGKALVEVDMLGRESFLSHLRTRLKDSAILVDTCLRAHDQVSQGMMLMRANVTNMRCTITELEATTADLIMVGINAGLRAARRGIEGRSLMVIADELKRLAGVITTGSIELTTAYEALTNSSRSLDGQGTAMSRESMGAEILSIAAAFEAGDRHMTAFVKDLESGTRGFLIKLNMLGAQFHEAVQSIAALQPHADEIVRPAGAAPFLPPDVTVHLTEMLWSRYTMERERELHCDFLGSPKAMTDAGDDNIFFSIEAA